MMHRVSHSYQEFVRDFDALLTRGAALSRGGVRPAPAPAPRPDAPLALILAPHPDDECLVGALPRRLQQECGWRVAAAPVTLGSRVDRREERLAELREACGFLGWDVVVPEGGLSDLLRRESPRLVLFPHADDANATHRRVHESCLQALREAGPAFSGAVAETEYWSTLHDPNLMVETPAPVAGDLIAALSFHEGEVVRNPYHVLLPCWLADGSRRGAELVAGPGAPGAPFRFAALYRLSRWTGRSLERVVGPGRVAPAGVDLSALL